MTLSRRAALKFGAAGLIGLGVGIPAARAQEGGDTYPLEYGELVVHPVSHASLVLETPLWTIYVDPVGGSALYEGLPSADLILITHEHGDHLDVETLQAILKDGVPIITNEAVRNLLPEAMQARVMVLEPRNRMTLEGEIDVTAIPAYNTSPDRLQYHPRERGDNGYVLTFNDGMRIYIAGDTEDTEEMRALTDVSIAFLPMNLPYTMTIEQAASAVAAFAPARVYPYHYNDSDLDEFERLVAESGVATEVIRRNWYPEG